MVIVVVHNYIVDYRIAVEVLDIEILNDFVYYIVAVVNKDWIVGIVAVIDIVFVVDMVDYIVVVNKEYILFVDIIVMIAEVIHIVFAIDMIVVVAEVFHTVDMVDVIEYIVVVYDNDVMIDVYTVIVVEDLIVVDIVVLTDPILVHLDLTLI